MGQVLDLRRLRAAYDAVRSNRGEPGVDGVTVDAFGPDLEANLAALVVELRGKSYRPQPVRRVWIPKPDGGQRPLGIPAVRDRVVQQAVVQVLEPIFEADFSSHSHGFRPGRSTFSALRELYGQVRGGHVYIVDVDIEKFFDEIPHEPLIAAVAERVADGSVLRLVRLFLEALIQDGYRLVRPRAGTPQGGVVSPLLANIYLARMDRVLEAEGVSFVRYADDVRLSSRTPSGARQALTRIAEVLQGLGLRLSERKTKLVTAYQGVDFLGYRLVVQKGHLNVYISPKALERFREEVRRLTRRTAGQESPGGGVPTGSLSARLGGVLQARTGGRGVRPVRSLDSAATPRVCGEAVAQRTLATLPRPLFLGSSELDSPVPAAARLSPRTRGPAPCRQPTCRA